MINIARKEKAPKCLEKKKKYDCEEVLEKLQNDFLGKCYICETNFFSVNVEHFIPHKGNMELKYKWANLFLACNHCNNIKSTAIILDCTNTEHNVEKNIQYQPIFFPVQKIKIKANTNDKLTKNTVKLLRKIYNGHTKHKSIDAEKLKEYIVSEILYFQSLMLRFKKEKYNKFKQEEIEKLIKAELHRGSKLTAFKRQIVKNNKQYKKFQKYFD